MTIFEKLSAVQTELKAPKGQYNSYGKFNYRSCEDILEAVKPLCVANKALVMISDKVEQIGDRFYIKAFVTFRDLESDAEIVATAYAREDESKKGMDGSQVTGATTSYARKYALNGLFCIDDTKDADTDEMQRQTTQQQTNTQRQSTQRRQTQEINNPTAADVAKIAAETAAQLGTVKMIDNQQTARIQALAKEKNILGAEILKRYKVDSLSKLTAEQAEHCIKSLEATQAR